ncbi:MAG: Asp-tRNA(Asn)/Glu-tRNA(Gln) amidotransferase subunit GatB [Patescibacteria group bacterium]|nr:Asp-tRNA(Asn)/Glu-tRNA(Gln) amidotransferase subunit GatB [Patescibacteria group bacterium]
MLKPTIGLEIHAELKTKTKMFCGCPNDPEESHPNANVCPVCLGHPGVLPTANLEAVKAVIKLGMALGGNIPQKAKFDRKSYFYPDLPKGYQISQYDEPLVLGGELAGVKVRRVHLEEDTARLTHADDGESSLVDFNRAGVPLMELVTEPVIHSAGEALRFAKELQLLLRYLEISDADMEKGEMRVEANISLADENSGEFGTKVELKNINSFKAVEGAVTYEMERQSKLLAEDEKIVQETRGWDPIKAKTFSQRVKEEAHDYRYMPEPDIPPMDFAKLGEISLDEIKSSLPELPWQKRKRFAEDYALQPAQVDFLVADKPTADFYEEAISEMEENDGGKNNTLLFNYISSDLQGLLKEANLKTTDEDFKITPAKFADLMALIAKGDITSRAAKNVLSEMFKTGLDAHQIIKNMSLDEFSGEDKLQSVVREVIEQNEKAVADYKKGKENALQFLTGQVMTKTRGGSKPDEVMNLLRELI